MNIHIQPLLFLFKEEQRNSEKKKRRGELRPLRLFFSAIHASERE